MAIPTCKIYAFLGGVAGFVSINTLTAMACDRYNVIYRHKGLMKTGSRRHSFGLLVSVWIYSIFWSAPPFFGWGYFRLDGGRISCCFDYLTRSTSNVSYIIAIFVFCFGIQVVVILFCYANIVMGVCRHERSITRANMEIHQQNNHMHLYYTPHEVNDTITANNTAINSATTTTATPTAVASSADSRPSRRHARKRRVELQVTRLVLFIILSFCFCWTPFAVVALIGAFGDARLVTPLVSVLPGVLAKISTVINPILYAIGHPQYRNVLLKTFRRAQHTCRAPPEQDGNMAGRRTMANNGGMGYLSSMYFASVMRDTESGVRMTVQLADRLPSDATTV
nr:hypothetical protein BaRGS_024411 [Batillaria attramentaria]